MRSSRSCLANLPGDPRYYTTSVAVRDLDDVRAALGYQQIDLYGVSYGTRVAQHYMRRYPERVRAAVLDGVVPPELALGPTSRSMRKPQSIRRSLAALKTRNAIAPFRMWPQLHVAALATAVTTDSLSVPDPLSAEPTADAVRRRRAQCGRAFAELLR